MYTYSNWIRFPFGKYKSQCVRDVPTAYLRWIWTNVYDLEDRLRRYAFTGRG
jgi:hypothetical protein